MTIYAFVNHHTKGSEVWRACMLTMKSRSHMTMGIALW